MTKTEEDSKPSAKGRRRGLWPRGRPVGLMMAVILALVVIAVYQITMGLGLHDRESFIREIWNVLGIVLLFLLAGAGLGLLLALVKSWQGRRRGPSSWESKDDDHKSPPAEGER